MPNQQRKSSVWELLLVSHLVLYGAFFVMTLSNFSRLWYESQNNFIILLLWMPLLLIHTAITYYQRGRGNTSQLEREAYRDGYADAMRQLSSQGVPPEPLALDDEGELVRLKEKRKHTYYEERDA